MFGNPVLGPRIVPFRAARTSTDYLPNGNPGFRVTQRYGDWDAFFHNRIHGAMDIANFNCGDVVLAMASGTATPLQDPDGALGVEVAHPNGYRSQYWHLSRRAVQIASVRRGQVIGYVGRTGLNIAGCHLHVVVYDPAGQSRDPWPLLDQNIPPTTTTAVAFNSGVDGVNLRDRPDSRAGRSTILAIAYSDSNPAPNGIIWQVGTSTTTPYKGQRVGSTGAKRRLYRVVVGTDGVPYNELQIAGTGRREFVQSRFMHRVL